MVSAVVLAAGTSTRMGTQKLLLPLAGEPIVHRTVRQICDAGFDDVLVVVGYRHSDVLAALARLPVRSAINGAYETGMGSSFRTGVEHVPPSSSAAVFALGDQPFVSPREYRALLDAYRQSSAAIVSVRYGDVTAPPHLFSRTLFPELAVLTHGARPVLQRHADAGVVLQFPPDLLMDIDTPADYERAARRASSGS